MNCGEQRRSGRARDHSVIPPCTQISDFDRDLLERVAAERRQNDQGSPVTSYCQSTTARESVEAPLT